MGTRSRQSRQRPRRTVCTGLRDEVSRVGGERRRRGSDDTGVVHAGGSPRDARRDGRNPAVGRMTPRRYRSGTHAIELLVNGVAIARACFELEVEGEVLTHRLVG